MLNNKWIISAAALATLCGSALALAPEDTKNEDKTVLKGPQVEDGQGPGSGETMTGERRVGEEQTPFRAYLMAVRTLERAGDDLKATDDQKEAIRKVAEEHRAAMAAFIEEHKEEIDALRKTAGPAGREGGPRGPRGEDGPKGPPPGEEHDPMMGEPEDAPQGEPSKATPEERQAAAEKLRELMSKAPSDEGAKKQLWAILTDTQKAHVEKTVEEGRKRLRERQAEGGEGEGPVRKAVRQRRQAQPGNIQRKEGARPENGRKPADD